MYVYLKELFKIIKVKFAIDKLSIMRFLMLGVLNCLVSVTLNT